ncbi:tetracycline repressor protein class H [Spongiactinospora gelatinilytica]|uniref:Tetracycline repressor protein class H n=2 Tax=Spongiactinospora gelatinilytica TaxID=2666298 RepID=A0A2W2H126_9ACTN|nr:tetracycline repressor protein class H [Spongiactinospora gelatinilytica]
MRLISSGCGPRKNSVSSNTLAGPTYAGALTAALLAHPNLFPLMVTRPAITPGNLRAMEDALTSLGRAGFPPGTAPDILYSAIGFVVGHVAIQVASGRGQEPDPSLLSAGLTPGEFPLLSVAVAAGRELVTRFGFALDAMLSGFETARRPGGA